MKNIILPLIIIGLLILSGNLFAQDDEWTTQMSKDGKVEVSHHIGSRIDSEGNEAQLAEYKASSKSQGSLDNYKKVFEDVSIHKEFMDNTEISKEIKSYSENENLVYYYFDMQWPLPNSDCVMKMTLNIDEDNKTLVYEGSAYPGLYEETDVKRINYYTVKYIVKEIDDGIIEVIMESKITPASSGPNWLVGVWFPKGPAKILSKLIELANDIN